MKKLTRMVLSVFMGMAALLGMAVSAYGDDVSKAAEINEVTVENLENVGKDDWPAELDFVKNLKSTNEIDVYYKFTLDAPSRVYFKSFIQAVQNKWEGEYQLYISTSGIFTEELLAGSATGDTSENTLYLEKGTYYLKYHVKVDADKILDQPQGYMGIYQEKMKRSGSKSGDTMKNAITVNNGKYGNFKTYGASNKIVKTQWFKVVVNSKSDVKFVVDFLKPSGYLNLYMELYKSDESNVDKTYNTTTMECTLERGTYYLQVIGANDCYGQIRVNTSIKDVYPPEAPVIKSYTSGSKTVSGTAERGSTVYVRYDGKTYRTTAANSGTYKVTVPALKVGNKITVYCADSSKNKSQSSVATVKNRKLTTPKVVTYKKGTKVVKGTAQKGTTVYVNYNGKTYKAKVTGNGKYAVKTAELVSRKKVRVFIKDAYNNSSSTKTVTVR